MRKILIVSDVGPTKNFTGGLVLLRISEYLAKYFQIEWLILHQKHHAGYVVGLFHSSTKLTWLYKPVENWSTKFNWLGISVLGEKFADKETNQIWSHIRRQISRDAPDHILLVLQGQTSFKIARHLLEESIEFSTLNWDPWIWWSRTNKVPKKFDKEVDKIFARLAFQNHLVPTGEIASRYGILTANAATLYPYVPKLERSKEKIEFINPPDDKINLVYSGQIYAPIEFDYLLAKLDAIGWTIGKKDIKLHYFGKEKPPKHRNIVNHGFIDPEDLVVQLSFFDIGILTYPHTESIPEVAQLSFPSKYATYAAASLPTIYLGPNNTPVSKMISEDIDKTVNYESLNMNDALQDILSRKIEIKERIDQRYQKFFSQINFEETLNSVFAVPDIGKFYEVDYQEVNLLDSKKVSTLNHSYAFNALTSLRIILYWTRQRFTGPWRRVKTLYFFVKMLSRNFVRQFIRR